MPVPMMPRMATAVTLTAVKCGVLAPLMARVIASMTEAARSWHAESVTGLMPSWARKRSM
jgi:hypothetical protein